VNILLAEQGATPCASCFRTDQHGMEYRAQTHTGQKWRVSDKDGQKAARLNLMRETDVEQSHDAPGNFVKLGVVWGTAWMYGQPIQFDRAGKSCTHVRCACDPPSGPLVSRRDKWIQHPRHCAGSSIRCRPGQNYLSRAAFGRRISQLGSISTPRG